MDTLKKTEIGFQDQLLAHLSRGLIGELIVYRSLVVRPSTFSNISETTGPIKIKFHMETS